MANITVVSIADAVVRVLETVDSDPAPVATRGYAPRKDLKSHEALYVTVIPTAVEWTRETRKVFQWRPAVDIGIQKKVAPTDTEALDALIAFVDLLASLLVRTAVTTEDGTKLADPVVIRNEPVYSLDRLDEQSEFLSVLSVEYMTLIEPA